MSWWQAGILIWIAASLAVAAVIARSGSPRRWRARDITPDAGSPTSDVLTPIMHVLAALLDEAEHRPEAVARLSWVESLLTDGYGVALSLEAEWGRLGREIDDLLDAGGPDAESRIAVLARRRRHAEHDARQLRERLDAVWSLTHAERSGTVPPRA